MLKYEINGKQEPKMTAIGDKATLAADTLILIKMVFDSIGQHNPVEAVAYVHAIIAMLQDPNSPMWQEIENEQQPKLEQSHGGEGD